MKVLVELERFGCYFGFQIPASAARGHSYNELQQSVKIAQISEAISWMLKTRSRTLQQALGGTREEQRFGAVMGSR